MSKIGKRPINIEGGVTVIEKDRNIVVSSGEKQLQYSLPEEILVKIEEGKVLVSRNNDTKTARSLHGLSARLINNMIVGVSKGFEKILEFTGTGYRVQIADGTIALNMGYSHEIVLQIPDDLEVKIVKNRITVSGINKEHVGQFAAKIRSVRPPEVYKGKGIRYKDEVIKRKAGKTAASK